MIYFVVANIFYFFFEDYLKSVTNKDIGNFSILNGREENNLIEIERLSILDVERKNKYIFLTTPLIYRKNHPIQKSIKRSQLNESSGKVELSRHQIIILNTEQLSKINERTKITTLIPYFRLVDYSLGNLAYIDTATTEKKYLYLPYQLNKDEILDLPKTKSVCFVGLLHGKYRTNILQGIQELGIDVTIIKRGPGTEQWGQTRDKELFSHKILVNIHNSPDYNVHEQLRVNRCVFNRVIVVTEKSSDDSLLFLKDHILFCEYDQLVDTVIKVLENYDHYYEKLFGDFDLEKIDQHYTEKLMEFKKKLDLESCQENKFPKKTSK